MVTSRSRHNGADEVGRERFNVSDCSNRDITGCDVTCGMAAVSPGSSPRRSVEAMIPLTCLGPLR